MNSVDRPSGAQADKNAALRLEHGYFEWFGRNNLLWTAPFFAIAGPAGVR